MGTCLLNAGCEPAQTCMRPAARRATRAGQRRVHLRSEWIIDSFSDVSSRKCVDVGRVIHRESPLSVGC
ncbi:hypothetical protein MRX96_012267 [Rhipicephalus microplus]